MGAKAGAGDRAGAGAGAGIGTEAGTGAGKRRGWLSGAGPDKGRVQGKGKRASPPARWSQPSRKSVSAQARVPTTPPQALSLPASRLAPALSRIHRSSRVNAPDPAPSPSGKCRSKQLKDKSARMASQENNVKNQNQSSQ